MADIKDKKCPECDYKSDATNLFIHVWVEHRDANFGPCLNPCPWCGVLEKSIRYTGHRWELRSRHLEDCLPFIASRLSNTRIADDLVWLQIERFKAHRDRNADISFIDQLFQGAVK